MAALRALLRVLLGALAVAGPAHAQVTANEASRYSAAVAAEWFRVVLPAIQQTPALSSNRLRNR